LRLLLRLLLPQLLWWLLLREPAQATATTAPIATIGVAASSGWGKKQADGRDGGRREKRRSPTSVARVRIFGLTVVAGPVRPFPSGRGAPPAAARRGRGSDGAARRRRRGAPPAVAGVAVAAAPLAAAAGRANREGAERRRGGSGGGRRAVAAILPHERPPAKRSTHIEPLLHTATAAAAATTKAPFAAILPRHVCRFFSKGFPKQARLVLAPTHTAAVADPTHQALPSLQPFLKIAVVPTQALLRTRDRAVKRATPFASIAASYFLGCGVFSRHSTQAATAATAVNPCRRYLLHNRSLHRYGLHF